MKLLLFSYLFICCTPVLKGQDFNEYTAVDNKALHIPAAETYSTTSIANYVQSNFKTDREKLRAIYTWVTANIRYDKDSMYNINWGADPEAKISAALRRRKGVCENYAAIFTDIALKSGIQSYVVTGYTGQSGSVKKTGHSWCAVYLEKEWFLCDPTWDIGFRNNTKYFLVSPDQFIESHMPFDPLWQLLPYPLSQQEFYRGIVHSKKNDPPWNVYDSVKAFLQLDSLHQLEASSLRMKQAGLENDMLKIWHSYIEMKIAIVYGDKDMNLYNSAVADLNRANTIFNDFVQYRNNQFTPSRPDAEINALLDPIAGILASAWKKLDNIGQSVENFQYDTGALKNRLDALTGRVQEQQNFLKRYFAGTVAERGKFFYR